MESFAEIADRAWAPQHSLDEASRGTPNVARYSTILKMKLLAE
jgi:hypothetical protein